MGCVVLTTPDLLASIIPLVGLEATVAITKAYTKARYLVFSKKNPRINEAFEKVVEETRVETLERLLDIATTRMPVIRMHIDRMLHHQEDFRPCGTPKKVMVRKAHDRWAGRGNYEFTFYPWMSGGITFYEPRKSLPRILREYLVRGATVDIERVRKAAKAALIRTLGVATDEAQRMVEILLPHVYTPHDHHWSCLKDPSRLTMEAWRKVATEDVLIAMFSEENKSRCESMMRKISMYEIKKTDPSLYTRIKLARKFGSTTKKKKAKISVE
jgi:hypothetical protein